MTSSSDKVIDLAHFSSGQISKTMIALIKKNPKKIRLIFTFYTMKLFGFLWHQILKGAWAILEIGPDEKCARIYHFITTHFYNYTKK